MTPAMTPLPSLLRASAWDAGNMSVRKAGRTKWSRADFNAAAAAQERLIKACYWKDSDHADPNRCYLRFGFAEQLERRGIFRLDSNFERLFVEIDAAISA